MYQKSKASQPLNLFSNVPANLHQKSSERLLNPSGWHNVFFEEVIAPFPEDIFSVLYSSTQGRPNTSIRILVGMLILKEGHGWTDEQLFEAIHFNLQIRWALGLRNLDDAVTGSSTYYDFKKAVQDYQQSHDEDLLEKAFEQLTFKQINKYRINGRHFRMDAKLYNSNIASSNLVRLLSETLQLFLRGLSEGQLAQIAPTHSALLVQLAGHSADGIAYRQTKVEKEAFILNCGSLLQHLCTIFDATDSIHYPLLERLLSEQYECDTQTKPSTDAKNEDDQDLPPLIQLKERDKIDGSTLQSPHDPDAAYRKKQNGGSTQEVRGYTTNIGETCHPENPFNLITTATTAPVTAQDNDFVTDSIEQTRRVSGTVDKTWMDGAYSSADNRNWLLQQNITAYFPALAGHEGYHHFEWIINQKDPDNPTLQVTDLRDGKQYTATLTKSGKSYRITYDKKRPDGQNWYRYFKPQEIDNYFVRRQIEQLPKEILNRRANIEATIHQVFCKMGNQSKYRGLVANHMMVLARCFWVNCRRITQNKVENALQSVIFTVFTLLHFTGWSNACFGEKINYSTKSIA